MPHDSQDSLDDQDLISGGHLVAKALKAEGVEVIYTLCGGHIIDIYDGCVDEGIDVADVRHEQVAAHAADGYARLTGKPGCAVVTAGPGTTDAVTGVETLVRYDLPFVGIVGNNSSMNQIRYGQKAKYGEARERSGNTLGDVPYDQFARMLGGHGEEVREPSEIRPALERARASGKPSLVNVWIDPDAYAPGTMNQTMYK